MPKGKGCHDGVRSSCHDERLIISDSQSSWGPGYDVVSNHVTTFYHQSAQHFCVRYSLANVFSFKGLSAPERLMIDTCDSDQDYSLIHAVQMLQRKGGVKVLFILFTCVLIFIHYSVCVFVCV